MKGRMRYGLITFALIIFAGCGKRLYFEDYLPFSTGYKWTFEDDNGALAEIEVSSDSLSAYRDTIYKVFFLGRNIDFQKTPNALLWHFIKRVVIEDREVFMEDRYYPFFEMPFVNNKTGRIVYEKYDEETGAYFRRIYEYVYTLESRGVEVNITMDALYFYNNDSTCEQESYTFLLVPDTGFTEITYTENGEVHHFRLKEYLEE